MENEGGFQTVRLASLGECMRFEEGRKERDDAVILCELLKITGRQLL